MRNKLYVICIEVDDVIYAFERPKSNSHVIGNVSELPSVGFIRLMDENLDHIFTGTSHNINRARRLLETFFKQKFRRGTRPRIFLKKIL